MRRGMQITTNGDGSQTVQLGAVVSALITAAILAGGGALITVGILGWRTSSSEHKISIVEKDVARQGRNQMRIDERQRHIRKDVRWANAKLDALLEETESTRRIPEPELSASSLEPPSGSPE